MVRTLMGESSLFDTHSMVVRNVCEARRQGQGGAREGDKRMGDEKRGKERPRRKNAKTKRRDKDKEENEEEKKKRDNERRKERQKDTERTTKKKKRKEKKRGEWRDPLHSTDQGFAALYVRRDQKDPVHLAPDLEPAPLACSRVDRRQKSGLRVPGQPARAATRNVL